MCRSKNKKIFLAACILLAAAVCLSLTMGSYQMTLEEIFATFFGKGNRLWEFTIYESRLPRIVLAVIVASALGISGCILQAVTRNPLAEPGVVGINAGAALMVVLWIAAGTKAYYSVLPVSSAMLMPAVAMFGSLLSLAVVCALSYKQGIGAIRFILCGIGVNAAINAVISFCQLSMSKGDFNQVLTWTNGSLWGSSWNYIVLTIPPVLVLGGVAVCRAKVLDVLALGDELASGVGLSVHRERPFFLVLATLLAACATAVAGNIAFLALLGPQLAKKLAGNQHKVILPLSAMIASILLVGADVIARTLFSPIEIPVGIVVSIVGVPYFIYLMLKGK